VVPDLAGQLAGGARIAVEGQLLVWGGETEQFDDVVPAGAVISQDPAPGTEVERGSSVTVVVSKGVDLVVFPDLSAAPDYEAAAAILTEAGFAPRLVFGDAQGVIQELTIGGEVPQVGSSHRRGTVVDVSAL
jgi:serine/threonine-protein kinase